MRPAANFISKFIQRQRTPQPDIPDGLYIAYKVRVVNVDESPRTNYPVIGSPVPPIPQASPSVFVGANPRQTPPSTDIAYKLKHYGSLSKNEKMQLLENVITKSDEVTRRMAAHRVLTPPSGDSYFANGSNSQDVKKFLVESKILNNRAEIAKNAIHQRTLSWKKDSK